MEDGLHVLDGGRRVWVKNNKLHRVSGPAEIITERHLHFAYKGEWHRLDGPCDIAPATLPLYSLYGYTAGDKKRFLNKSWRRGIMLRQIVKEK
jgi:hypothetical protein